MNFRNDAPNRDDSVDDREISNNSIGDGIHEIRELKFSDRIDAQEARQDQYRRNASSKALDGSEILAGSFDERGNSSTRDFFGAGATGAEGENGSRQ
jgi:hypothetical protein